MTIQTNLKHRIRSGEITIGAIAPVTATKNRIEDIMGSSNYSYLNVDSQHGPYDERLLVEFCEAADQVGVPVMFRIKHTRHSYLVGNILDLGPAGVEIPQTETEETTQEALDYFYYPQVGKRSWGGPPTSWRADYTDRLEYAKFWNDYGVLSLQIESLSAVTRAKTFARPGVDMLSWGPADLSFNREANPDHPLKTDDDCIKHTLMLLEGTETKLSIRNYQYELRNKYLDMGATVLIELPFTQ
ncbi:MAG: aldolase/citrate lyase family protein [Dehalococcoidia bacterium]|nr:aldolase/citrate lyase family protein [Dehalococcoidia bacterium]